MAFTGQGGDWSQALHQIDEDKEANLDALAAKSQVQRDEAADISLDGLRLTPTNTVQQEVAREQTTGSCEDADATVSRPEPRTAAEEAPLEGAFDAALDEDLLHETDASELRAHDGVRGDKRWKIEYGDVVYITDEQQKLVITTYQLRPRADSLYIGPAPPPPTYPPPPIYMPPAPILTPIVEGSIPLFQPPPPPMIPRSTAWPVAPPMEVKICVVCGKVGRRGFRGRQWGWLVIQRCNVCWKSGRLVSDVDGGPLPPLPDEG